MSIETGPKLSPHDLTINRIADFIVNHEVDRVEIDRFRRVVFSGVMHIRLEHELKLRPSIEQSVVNEITNILYLSSAYLKRPLPDKIEPLKKRSQGSASDNLNADSYQTVATWRRTKDCPNGVIRFLPRFIQEMADYLDGRGVASFTEIVEALTSLPAHEFFHGLEEIKVPSVYKRDVNILEGGGVEAWDKTWTERGAELFGDCFSRAYIKALMERPRI
jgi:hypothetical protein